MARTERSQNLLESLQAIIAQYPDIKMTVRQVYYRAVAAQIIANSQNEYNRVKRVLAEARLSGDMSFEDIEDRTRTVVTNDIEAESEASYFKRYYDYLRNLNEYYRLPRWYGQPTQVVVLVEKQALEGIFKTVTDDCKVDLLVCRGYPSLSVLYQLANRMNEYQCDQIDLVYFGDYDPSGKDIDRNVEERLTEDFNVEFTFQRIAITPAQIRQYDIPPAPAKRTDSRYNSFLAREGVAVQVELDAIDPPILMKLIKEAVEKRFDNSAWNKRVEEVKRRRENIKGWIAEAFNEDFEPPEDDEDEDEEDEDNGDGEDGDEEE